MASGPLSLAEAGQLPLHLETVDVGELLADAQTSFSGQAEAAGKRYGLALEAFEKYLAEGGDEEPTDDGTDGRGHRDSEAEEPEGDSPLGADRDRFADPAARPAAAPASAVPWPLPLPTTPPRRASVPAPA